MGTHFKRTSRVAVASAAAALLAACSLAVSLDGLSGGPPDAAPAVDAPVARDGAVEDAATDAPMDAPVDAPVDAPPFCGTIDADFCADFDPDLDGAAAYGFFPLLSPASSELRRDLALSLSPPASYLGLLDANDGGGQAILLRDFGTSLQFVTDLEFSYAVFVPEYRSDPLIVSALWIGTRGSAGLQLPLELALDGTGTPVARLYQILNAADASTQSEVVYLTRTPPAGAWSQIRAVLSASPPRVAISIDGNQALSAPLDTLGPLPVDRRVVIGVGLANLEGVPSVTQRVNYDNVLVRLH
jgi:hypothetical protein